MRKNSPQSLVQKSVSQELYIRWGSAVYNTWQTFSQRLKQSTIQTFKKYACAENRLFLPAVSASSPLLFHPRYALHNSVIQALIPTIHTAYNKHNDVYIK